MFLGYVDASGVPERTDPLSYTLGCVIIHEEDWQEFDSSINCLKNKYFPNLSEAEVEFHAKDMTGPDGIYAGMSYEEIYVIFDDIFDLISDPASPLCIISVVIEKSRLHRLRDVELFAYKVLYERFNSYISLQNEALTTSGYNPQFGIIIIDSDTPDKDSSLRNKILTMLRFGTDYSGLNFVVEQPLFSDSTWRNVIQLSDCVAYCVRKKFKLPQLKVSNIHTEHWNRYFDQILPKFHSRNGIIQGHGLKIFPEEGE